MAALNANTMIAVGEQGSILRTTDAGATWTRISSGTAARLSGVSFADANTGIAVGDQGAILRTVDGGSTWTPQPSGTTNVLWGVSFTDAGTGTVVGDAGTILRTTDGGATWSRQSSGTADRLNGVSFTSANTGTIVGANGTILRTVDGGVTWKPQSSGTRNWLYGVSFISANTGFVVGDGGVILRTTNGGATWTPQSSGFLGSLFAISFADASTGIAVGARGAVLRITDGGATWTQDSSGTTSALFAVASTDAGARTAVGDQGTILRTTDRGDTWKAQSRSATSNTLIAVFFTDSSTGTVVGGNGTILRTTDGGVTWTPQSSGTTNWLWGVSFTDADDGIVVGDAGTILRTTDGGATWSRQSSGTTGRLCGVSFTSANTGTVVGANGTILRTTDGGATWSSQSSGTLNWLYGVSFADANTGTVVGDNGTILRTTDGGATWTRQSIGSIRSSLHAVAMTDPDTVTTVGDFNNIILRTTDGGVNWGLQSSGVPNLLSGVWFTDANTGVVVGGQGACGPSISTILRTTDGGATWKRQVTGSNRALFGVFFTDANTGWAVGEAGTILHTTTGGEPPATLLTQSAVLLPMSFFARRGAGNLACSRLSGGSPGPRATPWSPISRSIINIRGLPEASRPGVGCGPGGPPHEGEMNMNALHRILIAGIAAAALFAGTVAAQTVVIGTGDPDIDIAAVQSAVDQGGSVVLRGHFSFDNPPTKHGALDGLMAVILVSKPVTISGAWDEHGEMTAIHGGEIPFAVEARGAGVRIERLRFVRPKRSAIFVDAVSGLAIESCAIESVEPLPPSWNSAGNTLAIGIYVSSLLGLPSPERPGNPENVSGKLSIVNNEISVSEGADQGMGIMIVSVGDSEKPVEVDVSGNTIRNSTLKGINVKQIGGQARIERNIVTTSVVRADHVRNSGIHCGGSGSYRVAYNLISVADPYAAGIRIRGYPAAIERATITDNDVTMSAPEGAVLGAGARGSKSWVWPEALSSSGTGFEDVPELRCW